MESDETMKSPLSLLWKDKMDVYRHQETEKDGFDRVEETLVASSIPCHYSQGSLVQPGKQMADLESQHKLFCSVSADIKEGDKVIATLSNGMMIQLMIGEGLPYSTHSEFTVKRSDRL